MRLRAVAVPALLVTLGWVGLPILLHAIDCAPQLPVSTGFSDTVKINAFNSGQSINWTAINYATGEWSACGGSSATPSLTSGSVDANLFFLDGSFDDRAPCTGECACARTFPDANNQIDRTNIYLFEADALGQPCPNTNQIVTHELGHALGLADAPFDCAGLMMGAAISRTNDQRTVQAHDCASLDSMWLTADETVGSTEGGPLNPDTGDGEDDTGGERDPLGPDATSPLLLDLDGNGIKTVGLGFSVLFDIDGDGEQEEIGWTYWQSEEAFLWLDLNENGSVDDGRELFGTATVMPDGTNAPNGFEALGVHDLKEMGGDGNGIIDHRDLVWHDLRLWVDRNHDGVSQSEEVARLDAEGVIALDLEYQETEEIDGGANVHRFQGKFTFRIRGKGPVRTEARDMTDVFFRLRE